MSENNQTNTSETTNQTLEQNIKNTFDLVEKMMNVDGVNNQTKTSITAMINLVLNSETYISGVREQIKTIISDGVFNQNDIPNILTIVINSKTYLNNILLNSTTIANNLDIHMLKYIIYAVIHFVMVLEHANPSILESLDTMYSPLWNLISINPQELVSDVSKITNKCFSYFPCFHKK